MQRHVRLDVGEATDVVALKLDQGNPAMLVQRPREGSGVVVTLAFTPELDWTDLPLKPFMVPLFQEAVRGGRALAASQRGAWAGETAWLGSAARGGLLVPVDAGLPTIEIDGDGRTRMPIPAPGLWKVRQRDGRERWLAVRLDPTAASIEPVDAVSIDAWRRGVGTWQDRGASKEAEIGRAHV